jgi:hypothetical protein
LYLFEGVGALLVVEVGGAVGDDGFQSVVADELEDATVDVEQELVDRAERAVGREDLRPTRRSSSARQARFPASAAVLNSPASPPLTAPMANTRSIHPLRIAGMENHHSGKDSTSRSA